MATYRRTWDDILDGDGPEQIPQYQYLAQKDFQFFFERILGYEELNPMQREIYSMYDLSNLGKVETHLCVEAPRQHGKTLFGGVGLELWLAYKSESLLNGIYKNYPWIASLVVSGSEGQSKGIINKTKAHIEDNEALNFLKPDSTKDSKWSVSEIMTTTKFYLTSLPFTSSIRGGTYHFVNSDDLLRDNKISQSQAIKTYVEVIIPTTIETKGLQAVTGTPQTGTDLFNYIEEELYKKTKRFKFKRFAAVWDADDDGKWDTTLWPKKYSVEDMFRMKDIMGIISFAKEMLCDPKLAGENLFSWEMIEGCLDLEVREIMSCSPGWQYYMGVDVAFSNSKTADFGSFSILGVNKNQVCLVYQYRKKGMTPKEYDEHIFRLHKKFNFIEIVVEEKGLSIDMVARLKEDRYLGSVVRGFKTGRGKGVKDEKDRIVSRLQTSMSNGHIRFPKNYGQDVEILFNELMNFAIIERDGKEEYGATSGHDDTVMSLCLAHDAATDPNRGKVGAVII